MNKYVIFSFSLGIGFVVGFFFGNKSAMKKVQIIADEQVEDTKKALKAYYEDKLDKKKTECQEDEEQPSIDMGVDPGINDEPKKPVEDPRSRFQESPKTIQSGVSDVMKRPKNLPPTAVSTPDGYPDPNDKKAPPYLIREEDYGELDDWDTLELIFWKDGVVSTDDSVCEIVSPGLLFKLLPEKWPNMFGWGDEKGKYDDVIYFRNNEERRDIQISKDLRTYKEWIEEVYPGRLEQLEESDG